LRAGGVSIIYISHFLEECQRICDGYTVLRDGQKVGSGAISETTILNLVKLMVGREVTEMYPKIPHTIGEPVLEAKDLVGIKRPRQGAVQKTLAQTTERPRAAVLERRRPMSVLTRSLSRTWPDCW